MYALYSRLRSLRIRADRRKKVIAINEARPKRDEIDRPVHLAVQVANGLKGDEVICPFSGSLDVEKAHMISHSNTKEYRSKMWFKICGFADYLSSSSKLAEPTNTWPINLQLHRMLDKARPEAVLFPTEATCVEAIRLAERALALRCHDQRGHMSLADFLEGWSDVVDVDGVGFKVFEYSIEVCRDGRDFKRSLLAVADEDSEDSDATFLVATGSEYWPTSTMPAFRNARLPLDLTHVQIMVVNWIKKGLGKTPKPVAPHLARILTLCDYRLALMECDDSHHWKNLPRPELPFPLPASSTATAEPIARRFYGLNARSTMDRSSPPPFSSSPPREYRTGDIVELVQAGPSGTKRSVQEAGPSISKRRRRDDDDDDDVNDRDEGRNQRKSVPGKSDRPKGKEVGDTQLRSIEEDFVDNLSTNSARSERLATLAALRSSPTASNNLLTGRIVDELIAKWTEMEEKEAECSISLSNLLRELVLQDLSPEDEAWQSSIKDWQVQQETEESQPGQDSVQGFEEPQDAQEEEGVDSQYFTGHSSRCGSPFHLSSEGAFVC